VRVFNQDDLTLRSFDLSGHVCVPSSAARSPSTASTKTTVMRPGLISRLMTSTLLTSAVDAIRRLGPGVLEGEGAAVFIPGLVGI
jgi:hypothetical protein